MKKNLKIENVQENKWALYASELEKFKEEIDIIGYALKNGYNIDKRKDSATWRALRSVSNSELIIVSKSNRAGYEMYFNPNDDNDKGTIIDFVKNRSGGELKEARRKLREYIGSPMLENFPKSIAAKMNEVERTKVLENFLKLDSKLTDRAYLHSRGISDATLDNKAFKNRIFNNTNKGFINTVFPIYDNKGLIGVEQKNQNFKGITGYKAAGLWMSNPTGKLKDKLDSLVITESGVDALSYHQLKYKPVQNNMYLATIGTVTEKQTLLIQKLIDKKKPDRVIIAMDNDASGKRYAINLLSQLKTKEQTLQDNAEIKIVPAGKDYSRLKIHLLSDDGYNRLKIFENVKTKFKQDIINNGLSASNRSKDWEISFKFKNTSEAFKNVEDIVRSLKKPEGIEIDMPISKDFNDDLNVSLSKELKGPDEYKDFHNHEGLPSRDKSNTYEIER